MQRIERALFCGAVCSGLIAVAAPVAGQGYPAKPVRVVVSFAAGGSLDGMVRIMGQKMTESMGQTIVVENRPGASGNIAAEHIARSAPDGYSAVAVSSTLHCANPHLIRGMRFDPWKDLEHVSLMAVIPLVLVVHPSVPARSVKDMFAFVKRNDGRLAFASSGLGTNPHLAGEQFGILAGSKMAHVPYKGGAPALVDVIGGQLPVMFPLLSDSVGHIAAGKVRAIALAAKERSAFAPEIPTFAEGGVKDFEFYTWFGLDAPGGTPKDIVAKLSAEVARALKAPDAAPKYRSLGLEIVGSTPEHYSNWIRTDCQRIAALIKAVGLKPE